MSINVLDCFPIQRKLLLKNLLENFGVVNLTESLEVFKQI